MTAVLCFSAQHILSAEDDHRSVFGTSQRESERSFLARWPQQASIRLPLRDQRARSALRPRDRRAVWVRKRSSAKRRSAVCEVPGWTLTAWCTSSYKSITSYVIIANVTHCFSKGPTQPPRVWTKCRDQFCCWLNFRLRVRLQMLPEQQYETREKVAVLFECNIHVVCKHLNLCCVWWFLQREQLLLRHVSAGAWNLTQQRHIAAFKWKRAKMIHSVSEFVLFGLITFWKSIKAAWFNYFIHIKVSRGPNHKSLVRLLFVVRCYFISFLASCSTEQL